MSVRKTVRYTPQADLDLDDILLNSLERFGPEQTERYLNRLDQVIDMVARHPESTPFHPHLGGGVRSKPAESHLIVYRIDLEVIVILRILHGRMQVAIEDIPVLK